MSNHAAEPLSSPEVQLATTAGIEIAARIRARSRRDTSNETIADIVALLLAGKASGMTVPAFARFVGISPSAIYRWRSGRKGQIWPELQAGLVAAGLITAPSADIAAAADLAGIAVTVGGWSEATVTQCADIVRDALGPGVTVTECLVTVEAAPTPSDLPALDGAPVDGSAGMTPSGRARDAINAADWHGMSGPGDFTVYGPEVDINALSEYVGSIESTRGKLLQTEQALRTAEIARDAEKIAHDGTSKSLARVEESREYYRRELDRAKQDPATFLRSIHTISPLHPDAEPLAWSALPVGEGGTMGNLYGKLALVRHVIDNVTTLTRQLQTAHSTISGLRHDLDTANGARDAAVIECDRIRAEYKAHAERAEQERERIGAELVTAQTALRGWHSLARELLPESHASNNGHELKTALAAEWTAAAAALSAGPRYLRKAAIDARDQLAAALQDIHNTRAALALAEDMIARGQRINRRLRGKLSRIADALIG